MNGSERSARLKADRELIAGGLDPSQPYQYQIIALMRVLNECVCESIDAGSVDPLMTFLYANMGQTLERATDPKIACKKGCSFCCRIWVSVTTPEALHARKAIGGASRLINAIRAADAVTFEQSYEQRKAMKTECPLLEDHACSIHPSRPIVCRAAVSFDAAVCERAFIKSSGEGIPMPPAHHNMRFWYSAALAGAIKRAGLAEASYEYNSALDFLLTNPDAEGRWLAGEDVLSGQRAQPGMGIIEADAFRPLYEAAFRFA